MMRSRVPDLYLAPRFLALAFCMLGGMAGAVEEDASTAIALRLTEDAGAVLVDGVRLFDPDAVRRFYARRSFRPAWTGVECHADMELLVGAIEDADSHGLRPDDYHLQALRSHDRCAVDREVLATDAWLALAAHLHGGRLDPVSMEPDWTAVRPEVDLVLRLEEALAASDVARALERLAPPQPFYGALRSTLARLRAYDERGGWRGIDEGPLLRRGDSGPRVAQIRARLTLSGLLEEGVSQEHAVFDLTLESAVKSFQLRANLEPDGIVGPQTLRQLNRSAADRIAQVRVNLERWRWLPEDLGERHIRVNIADFRLEARLDGHVERDHRVIVGRDFRQTPSFSARMTYVALNPWWEVPFRLAVQDKLPLFRRDPGEIERLGFEFVDAAGHEVDPTTIDFNRLGRNYFPFRLRQRPGSQNALGEVKLMFPNHHHVYLHDTPSRGLFARTRRDFSSGCIRVEHAVDLTEWVLATTPGWKRPRIDAMLTREEETVVVLSEPLMVHLYYITAVATPEGGVRFLDDLYDRDPGVLAALDAPPPAAGARP